MLALFHAFSMKCSQIQRAIKLGDDELVASLDRELEPLIAAILAYKAVSLLEIYMQLQFMNNLIREEADDRSRVLRNSASLSALIDRYFGGASEAAGEVFRVFSSEKIDRDDTLGFEEGSVLNDVILDSLPNRVAVVTRDYRYLYSNAANSEFLKSKPMELVGRHISEFIGSEDFEISLKAKLDACFAGEKVECLYPSYRQIEPGKVFRCTITPLRAKEEVIGALLVMHEIIAVPAGMLVA
ncbi:MULTISPECIES: PAS domain-containing protein [Rhizobium]|uniref:PAS domain-containing protein n=1 Tax=Rhizobium tropici TaxID=398 RepID=A0A6P1C458_RHITR|nr:MULTISPECIES: PAS domain-containing protein [Rhizobium]AGB71486.1 PAS fold family protein [Rhizobium tropici CIAT 899]MBB4240151.1 PAS domain-containing protein [Rhizobium tropici]MBB5591421.1 PAS domain-containing protein [Rhizobium tropici]MBB6490495.1 PAS domain-containing protein [Rhizobium tropici]NEV10145.1 PAS domain-containing protein [Rhizobium tropici]